MLPPAPLGQAERGRVEVQGARPEGEAGGETLPVLISGRLREQMHQRRSEALQSLAETQGPLHVSVTASLRPSHDLGGLQILSDVGSAVRTAGGVVFTVAKGTVQAIGMTISFAAFCVKGVHTVASTSVEVRRVDVGDPCSQTSVRPSGWFHRLFIQPSRSVWCLEVLLPAESFKVSMPVAQVALEEGAKIAKPALERGGEIVCCGRGSSAGGTSGSVLVDCSPDLSSKGCLPPGRHRKLAPARAETNRDGGGDGPGKSDVEAPRLSVAEGGPRRGENKYPPFLRLADGDRIPPVPTKQSGPGRAQRQPQVFLAFACSSLTPPPGRLSTWSPSTRSRSCQLSRFCPPLASSPAPPLSSPASCLLPCSLDASLCSPQVMKGFVVGTFILAGSIVTTLSQVRYISPGLLLTSVRMEWKG
eukprot:762688-Hanusia_phi.AAC.1